MIDRKQSKIYFDVTAGRGSYDDEYVEEDIDIKQSITHTNELKINDMEISNCKPNENRAKFDQFFENRPQQLKKQNFTPLQQLRRHSYNKGPARRAGGRNYSQQTKNDNSDEKNHYYPIEIKSNHDNGFTHSNMESDQKTNGSPALNWSPMRISGTN